MLVTMFLVELVERLQMKDDEKIKVGVVQTAYANGSSSKYLKNVSLFLVQWAVANNPARDQSQLRPYRCQAPPSRRTTLRYRSLLRSQRSRYSPLLARLSDTSPKPRPIHSRRRQRRQAASSLLRTNQPIRRRCFIRYAHGRSYSRSP